MSDVSHVALLNGCVLSREMWDEFAASGEQAHVPEDLKPIADYIASFYANDPSAQSVSAEMLRTVLMGTIKDPKRAEQMREQIRVVLNADLSVPNARAAVRALRERRVREALATKLLIPSKDGPEAIAALIDEYVGLTGPAESDEALKWDPGVIKDALGPPTVPIFPRSLGDRLRGGLRPGHHMIVFARPEIGKTALALTITAMAASRGARVLYCTNEDAVRDLMMRGLVLFNRQPFEWVEANIEQAMETARGLGADRIRFHDMAPGSLAEVDRLTRKLRPDLVVVDQLRNLGSGIKSENMTQKLDSIAQGLRNIGKRHSCAVLSLTQAGDSARDKAVLDDGDVDNSNTGISAGCSVLVAIGATQIMRDAGERRLCILKNKLGGKHGYADVRLDPITLAYRDHI